MKPPANPQQYNHIASYKHGYELTPIIFIVIVDFHLNVLTDKKHSNFPASTKLYHTLIIYLSHHFRLLQPVEQFVSFAFKI